MTIVATILIFLGLIQLAIGVAGWTGRLPGNPYVGIRVPEVRKSQELWDTAHRIAGPFWSLAGLTLAAAGALTLNAEGWAWGLVVVAILATLVFIGMGAGMAAHTVALIDARASQDASCGDGGCGCGEGGCGSADDTGAGATAASSCGTDADACCSDTPAEDPAKDCGVTGGCGSCSLNGMCEGGNERFQAPAVDLSGVRKAAEQHS